MERVIPPNDFAAERYALGYALTFDAEPLARLEPKHFYADAHAHIFAAIRAGADGAEAVFRQLSATPHAESLYRVGGSPYLAELVIEVTDIPESPAAMRQHAASSADSIREHWRRRVLCEAIEAVKRELYAGNVNSADAWKRLKKECGV